MSPSHPLLNQRGCSKSFDDGQGRSGTVSAGQDDLSILYMGAHDSEQKLMVDDSLFGSLVEDGEVHPYNVSRSGVIMRVSFPWKG
jgi:hypothetical protein